MNSKPCFSIKVPKKKTLLLLLSFFLLNTQTIFAQLKIYSLARSITVCNTNGTDGTVNVTIENAGLNSVTQTLSNIFINTNLLTNAPVSAGIEMSTRVSTAVIQTSAGSTPVTLNNVSLLNRKYICNLNILAIPKENLESIRSKIGHGSVR